MRNVFPTQIFPSTTSLKPPDTEDEATKEWMQEMYRWAVDLTQLLKNSRDKDEVRIHQYTVEEITQYITNIIQYITNSTEEITNVYETINNALNTYYSARRAKVVTVNANTLTCQILDSSGTVDGTDITVTPIKHLGSNDLTGNVWPRLAVDNVISIFLDVDDFWYTTFVFDDTKACGV